MVDEYHRILDQRVDQRKKLILSYLICFLIAIAIFLALLGGQVMGSFGLLVLVGIYLGHQQSAYLRIVAEVNSLRLGKN